MLNSSECLNVGGVGEAVDDSRTEVCSRMIQRGSVVAQDNSIDRQNSNQEGPVVCDILDPHPGWLSRSVSGTGLNPDDDRIRTVLSRLQRGPELVAVPGHDPIVVISGCDQGGWITGPL